MKLESFKKWTLFGLLVAIAAFFLCSLPHFIQGGDSAELVAAGNRLFVPHPPGYPLWMWMQYAFTNFISLNSVFWRASLLSLVVAIGTLFLLGHPLRSKPAGVLATVGILAFSKCFSEAAVLPDVFSLHALIIAGIGYLFFFVSTESRVRLMLIPFLFCIGFAHHLTIVFLFPVVAVLAWEKRGSRRDVAVIAGSIAMGTAVVAGLYMTLLFCHPDSVFSWGKLENLGAVWRHFLRADYGTFKLAATKKSGGVAGFMFFLTSAGIELFTFVALMLISYRDDKVWARDRRVGIWCMTIVMSMIFLLAANIVPTGIGAEVLARFHVMPVVAIAFLAAFALATSQLKVQSRRMVLVVATVAFVALVVERTSLPGLANDAVFEDYAHNLLQQSDDKPAIIVVENDNAFFGLRYLQSVTDFEPKAVVISPSLLFLPWYYAKVQAAVPGFAIAKIETIQEERAMNLEEDVVLPNLNQVPFVVTSGFQDGKSTRTEFRGLGRRLEPGSGVFFNGESLGKIVLHSRLNEPAGGVQGFSKSILYSQYSHFYLARGSKAFREGATEKAARDFNDALEIVPYAFPALLNLCKINETSPKNDADPRCSKENQARVMETGAGYF